MSSIQKGDAVQWTSQQSRKRGREVEIVLKNGIVEEIDQHNVARIRIEGSRHRINLNVSALSKPGQPNLISTLIDVAREQHHG